MGVFGAFFGCIGVVGFNGRCSGACSGDAGFTLVCISGRCGDGGFTVDTWLCPVREKVRPAGSGGGCEREKVRPLRSQWLKIGVIWRAGRSFSRKCRWRGCAGRVFSRTGSRRIPRGELCCAAALVVGPSTGSVDPSMRSYTLWVAWWAACLGHHPSGQRAHEGARAASCRLECGGWVQRAAAGCSA